MTEPDFRTMLQDVLASPPGEGPDLAEVVADGRARRRRRLVIAPLAAVLFVAVVASVAVPAALQDHRGAPTIATPSPVTTSESRARIERLLDSLVSRFSPAAKIMRMTVGRMQYTPGLFYEVRFTDSEGTGSIAVNIQPGQGRRMGCPTTLDPRATCTSSRLPDGSHQQLFDLWIGATRKDGIRLAAGIQRLDGTFIIATTTTLDLAKGPNYYKSTRITALPTEAQLAVVARQVAAFAPRP